MNLILALSIVLLSGAVHASYYQDSCSNAEGTARWAHGHSENGAFFREHQGSGVYSFEEFEMEEINISFRSIKVLEGDLRAQWSSAMYTAKAVITPKPVVAERFKKLFGSERFEDRFICSKIRE